MKLTVGRKLGSGFGGVLALMVLSILLSYVKASAIKEQQNYALSVRVPSVTALKDLQRDLNQTQSKGRQAVLAGGDAERRARDSQKAAHDLAEMATQLHALVAKFKIGKAAAASSWTGKSRTARAGGSAGFSVVIFPYRFL
jgi:hypothetical protein